MKILTCYGVLLLLQMNNCFKQEDFRKCSQTGFCKRARSRAEDVLGKQKKQEFEWAIKDDVIKPRKKESSIYDFELVGKRNDNKSGSTLLKAELSILEDGGIIRVRIDEPGKGRYSIPSKDVISADLELYENQQEQIRIVYPEKKGTCSFIYAQFMVSIQYRPFKMWIFENGKERFILNDFGLFHVESNIDNDLFDEEDVEELALPGQRQHLSEDSWSDEVIAKPAPNPVDVDRQFRNFKDSLPKGRQSLSADILFPRIANVYGLPEHASSFNLQESFRMLGRNFTVLHEPYRLYNLDVFEYELDSPAALYGSVPFLMGVDRSEDALRTVGVLWNNPSETWVDIGLNPKNGIDKLAHFSSESGQLDLFFFIGSKPKDLSTKLAQVCGYPAMPPQFSLGYHQCRWNYKSEDDLLSVNQYFDDYGIPVDVLWLDIEHTDDKRYFTWDQQQFPNPIEMQKKIGESQRHLVNIVDPHIKVDQGYAVYLELASSKKYAVLNAKREMFEGSCWPGKKPMFKWSPK